MAERLGFPDVFLILFVEVRRTLYFYIKRRGWDSNPGDTLRHLTVFETAPFNHSGTSPKIFTENFWISNAVRNLKISHRFTLRDHSSRFLERMG